LGLVWYPRVRTGGCSSHFHELHRPCLLFMKISVLCRSKARGNGNRTFSL
jgi:hypothetical protein